MPRKRKTVEDATEKYDGVLTLPEINKADNCKSEGRVPVIKKNKPVGERLAGCRAKPKAHSRRKKGDPIEKYGGVLSLK